jgi:hypothetical protein
MPFTRSSLWSHGGCLLLFFVRRNAKAIPSSFFSDRKERRERTEKRKKHDSKISIRQKCRCSRRLQVGTLPWSVCRIQEETAHITSSSCPCASLFALFFVWRTSLRPFLLRHFRTNSIFATPSIAGAVRTGSLPVN